MNWLWVIVLLTFLFDGYRCKGVTFTEVNFDDNKKIRGFEVRVEGNIVRQFLGIPYAEAERFGAPSEHPGWQNTLDATARKPTCWQPTLSGFDAINKGAKMWGNNTEMDENCLYLNIWAPKISDMKPADGYPVMVWIYGGGFYSGSSYLDVYDGAFLVGTQDVIVVSMQYRVGPFGFLFFDPAKGVNGKEGNNKLAEGNQGLLDQAMALEWVKKNIHHFGGNPNSITIFGESAGAVSVSILWLSPHTKNNINRAIMESASVFARWGISTVDDAHLRGEKFAEACGCPSPSSDRSGALSCLQKKTPQELVNNLFEINKIFCKTRDEMIQRNLPDEHKRLQGRNYSTCLYFDAPLRPVEYGPMIPEDIPKLLAQKSEEPSELLLGVNKNEGMYFLLYGLAINGTEFLKSDGSVDLPTSMTNTGSHDAQAGGEFTTVTIGEVIDTDLIQPEIAEEPAKFYKLDKESMNPTETLMNRFDELTGDIDFICPTIQFADHVSKHQNAKVFFYSFEKRTASFPMPDWLGVMHGYEIEYVFGMPLNMNFNKHFYSFTPEEWEISRKVMKLWANFARSGDPNQGYQDEYRVCNWPKYEQPSKTHLVITDEFRTGNRLREEACQFWSDLKKRAAKGKR